MILCNTQADLEREVQYLEDMLAFHVEGVLIAPVGDRSRPHLKRLSREGVPFVLIDRSVVGFSSDLVQGDSVLGARQLVEHLIELGHTRIGMVTESDDVSTARDRRRGYAEALASAGIEPRDDLVAVSSATDARAARDAAERLLALPDPPTAIFAVNNIAVVGAVEAARARGTVIPDDLALVCFDDIEHVARVYPFLTVMAQPAETFGTVATNSSSIESAAESETITEQSCCPHTHRPPILRNTRWCGRLMHGAIEAGGTKWVCGVGTIDEGLAETLVVPTTTPEETLRHAVHFLSGHQIDAVGIGCFGPIDLDLASPTWGYITSTPKPGWHDVDIAGRLASALGVPVSFDTDVNAAALAEHVRGVTMGIGTFVYVTVGTGIGGGAMVNGRLLHGLVHPELGHMRVPHDRRRDPFPGVCPYHGDCLEGLASGEALRARWGDSGERLSDDAVWELESDYLALGIANIIFTLSPERIILGGGVMQQPGLLALVRDRVAALLGNYVRSPSLDGNLDDYIVAPALGPEAGVIGALELAHRLQQRSGRPPLREALAHLEHVAQELPSEH